MITVKGFPILTCKKLITYKRELSSHAGLSHVFYEKSFRNRGCYLQSHFLPYKGYLVEGGMSRRAYGGTHVTDNLNSSLMEYRLFTPVEHLITRLIKEKVRLVQCTLLYWTQKWSQHPKDQTNKRFKCRMSPQNSAQSSCIAQDWVATTPM